MRAASGKGHEDAKAQANERLGKADVQSERQNIANIPSLAPSPSLPLSILLLLILRLGKRPSTH